MARPSKRTPQCEAQIIQALSAGNTRRAACAYAGVHEVTFERWLNRFAGFADAVQKAEAAAEVRNVAIVQQAANKSWQAAAWWLERRRSADYALRTKTEVSGPDGAAIDINLDSRADLASRIARLAARAGMADMAERTNGSAVH